MPPSNKAPHSKLSNNNSAHRAFSSADDGGPFERLSTVHTKTSSEEILDKPVVHNNYRVKASAGHVVRTQPLGSDGDIPLEGISVQREVTVLRSNGKGMWMDADRI